MTEWTTVSHVRRRHHPSAPRTRWRPTSPPRDWRHRSPPGDRLPQTGSWGRARRGANGWRASALPLPYRRGFPQTLTQPVPPPKARRRSGLGTYTGTRSYTDVAGEPHLHEDDAAVKRLPAGPAMRRSIRLCYALIKAVHHLHQVLPCARGTGPRMINRMVDTLSTMIQPAAPTPASRLLIEGAAREWGYTVCNVLKQHYEDHLLVLMEEMSSADLLAHDWRPAFLVALRWARRNLPRITEAAIEDAETRLFPGTWGERDLTPTLVPEVPPPLSGPPPQIPPLRPGPPPEIPPLRSSPPPEIPPPRSGPPPETPLRGSGPPPGIPPSGSSLLPRAHTPLGFLPFVAAPPPPETAAFASLPLIQPLGRTPPPASTSPPASTPPETTPPVPTYSLPPSPPATPPPATPLPTRTLRPRRPPAPPVDHVAPPLVGPPPPPQKVLSPWFRPADIEGVVTLPCSECNEDGPHVVYRGKGKLSKKRGSKLRCQDCCLASWVILDPLLTLTPFIP